MEFNRKWILCWWNIETRFWSLPCQRSKFISSLKRHTCLHEKQHQVILQMNRYSRVFDGFCACSGVIYELIDGALWEMDIGLIAGVSVAGYSGCCFMFCFCKERLKKHQWLHDY